MEKESKTGDSQVPNTTGEVQESDQRNVEELPQLSPNTLKVAAAQCLNSWINYLQILNTMCSAGLRLSQSLMNLSLAQNISLATNCQTSWDELLKSTIYATNTVKTHIAAAMQDMSIGDTFTESDAQRQQDHNQQIITENLLTFVNLQYQFSLVGCEFFGAMAMCPSCQATPGGVHEPDCSMAPLQQFFTRPDTQESRSQNSSPHYPPEHGSMDSPKMQEMPRQQASPLGAETRGSSRGSSPIQTYNDMGRQAGTIETIRGPFPNPGQLHTMKYPFLGRGARSPLHFPLFPISGQRRWSEAAAQDVGGESSDGTMRRWSMPWDCGRVETGTWNQKVVPPSKLTVPPAPSSQERSRSTTPESQPPATGAIVVEGLAEAIQLLSCRPMRSSIPSHTGYGPYAHPWPETHEERMHRRMHPGPSSQRGNWQSVDVPNTGMSVTEHYDIFPPCLPLISRKSSSSTDSSSCLSIHSRSTSSSERGNDNPGGGDSIRIHGNLYSMWSGSEHLPFIKLPESQEPQDDSDTDDPSAERSGKLDFPKPT
ncbi:uncharacterized protein LOC123317966 [Coccinella septempunctata]|uniref:uncharacterized protein LOC123317966 n=1 Tax=Coccinella septempunctata TaxID=41139 RepID=UPI001D085B77|nr:uncharacterized protein LOC123317966 [Coccinella septempunctata]